MRKHQFTRINGCWMVFDGRKINEAIKFKMLTNHQLYQLKVNEALEEGSVLLIFGMNDNKSKYRNCIMPFNSGSYYNKPEIHFGIYGT